MNLLRWALAVFVIVVPLFGVSTSAQDVEESGAHRGVSCHDYNHIIDMIGQLWPDLKFTDGMTLNDSTHGVVLKLMNQNGRLFMAGHSYGHGPFDQQKSGYPCVTIRGSALCASDSTGTMCYVYDRGTGYLMGLGNDGSVFTFPAPTSAAGR